MLIVIHNLPSNTTYSDVKELLRKAGMADFILDKLESESPNAKRVTVGLAEESDAAILKRTLDGVCLQGQQIFIENMRQKKSMEPIKIFNNMYSAQPALNANYYQNYMNHLQNTTTPQVNAFQMTTNRPYPLLQAPLLGQANQQQWSADQGQSPVSWSTNLGTFQNNVPYYQQAAQNSVEGLSSLEPAGSNRREPRGRSGNEYQQVSYPDKSNLKKDDRYSKRHDKNDNQHNSRSHNQRDNDRSRDYNRSRDNDRSQDIDKNRDSNRHRDANTTRSQNIPQRNEDRHQASSRNDNARESRWDTHVRNKREWEEQNPPAQKAGRNVWNTNIDNSSSSRIEKPVLDSRAAKNTYVQQTTSAIPLNNRPLYERREPSNSNPKEFNQRPGNYGQVVTQSSSRYQEDTLKRKYEEPKPQATNESMIQERLKHLAQKYNAPQSAMAPPEKKMKIIEQPIKKPPLPLSVRINKQRAWMDQVTAEVAKGVLKSAGKHHQDPAIRDVYKALRKCIFTRLELILGDKLVENMQEMLNKYHLRFKPGQNLKFYTDVLKEVEYEKAESEKKAKENAGNKDGQVPVPVSGVRQEPPITSTQTSQSNSGAQMTPGLPQPNVLNTNIQPPNAINPPQFSQNLPLAEAAVRKRRRQRGARNFWPNPSENKPEEIKPGPPSQMQTPPVSNPAGNAGAVNLPKLPKSLHPNQKMPKYPLGDKQVYRENKKAAKMGILPQVDGPLKKALEVEMKKIEKLMIEACEETSQENGAQVENLWREAVAEIKHHVTGHVIKRALNICSNTAIRVYFYQGRPKREELQEFLKKYNVISLKKSDTKKFFIAHCGTFKGFDALCSLERISMGTCNVGFKPLHLTGPPKKSKDYAFNVNSNYEETDNAESDKELNEEINECTKEILNDSDVIVLEEEPEIVNLDDTRDDDENYWQDVEFENFETNAENNEEIKHKLAKSDSRVEESKIDQVTDEKDVENKEIERIAEKTESKEIKEPENIDNTEMRLDIIKELAEPKKPESPSLIVGDNSYLVLDDADDDELEESLKEIVSQTDITEEDLEDF